MRTRIIWEDGAWFRRDEDGDFSFPSDDLAQDAPFAELASAYAPGVPVADIAVSRDIFTNVIEIAYAGDLNDIREVLQ